MLLQVSVCPQGGGVVHSPGRDFPGQTPLLGRHPPRQTNPYVNISPRWPLQRTVRILLIRIRVLNKFVSLPLQFYNTTLTIQFSHLGFSSNQLNQSSIKVATSSLSEYFMALKETTRSYLQFPTLGVFTNQTKLAIMPILTSEALLRENKKNPVTKLDICY